MMGWSQLIRLVQRGWNQLIRLAQRGWSQLIRLAQRESGTSCLGWRRENDAKKTAKTFPFNLA